MPSNQSPMIRNAMCSDAHFSQAWHTLSKQLITMKQLSLQYIHHPRLRWRFVSDKTLRVLKKIYPWPYQHLAGRRHIESRCRYSVSILCNLCVLCTCSACIRGATLSGPLSGNRASWCGAGCLLVYTHFACILYSVCLMHVFYESSVDLQRPFSPNIS